MDTIHTIGRRKTAVARIYMSKGKGNITVNNREAKDYFTTGTLMYKLNQPFGLVDAEGQYDVKVNVINIKVNDKTYTLEKDKSIILDLPKIKKLGIEHGGCCGYGEYLDLLEEYKAADYSFINYLDEK